MSSYPSSSYYTAQVYETLPESLQEQDAASGYKLWYFIQALVGSLDSLASLYFDSVGGGSVIFPVDPAPVSYSPAMLKSNIASTDTAFTIFNTDPTWDQIDTSAPFPIEIEGERILVPGGTSYDAMVSDLAPSAWWKLSDLAGSTTALDSSSQSARGTYSNLLTANLASLENGNTVGWNVGANCTLSASTAESLDGSYSLALTSVAAGPMNANTPNGTSGFAVTAGVSYRAMASFLTAVTPQSCSVAVVWFNASGTILSSVTSPAVTDNTATWTGAFVSGVAPAGATFAQVVVQTASTAAASEVHYVDCISLAPGTSTTWEPGGLFGTQIPPYTGTVYGGVTFGRPGAIPGTPSDTAALFDGSSGYFEAATLTGGISSSFSVSLWCKPTANNGSNSRIFSWGGGGPQGVEIVLTTADYLSVDIEGASGNITLNGATLTLGEWVFVTIAYDGATLFVYIDGILDVSGAAVIGTMRPANPPFVGRYNGGGDYFEGDIAQVAIFPTALTAAQVLNLYNSTPNPNSYDWTSTEIALTSVERGWDNTQAAAHLASAGATGEFDIEHYFAAPGWSQILDINRCPAYALPWLGQFVGVDLSKTPNLTYEQSVQKILSRPGFSRGTVQSLKNALAAIINGSRPLSSAPINVSQILLLENTSPIGFNTASLFSAITSTGAITLQIIGVGAAWFNAAANSSLVVQIDSENILIPQGVYSFVNGPVSISIPLGNRGYGGTAAANHSTGASITTRVSPSMYQYNQYGITLLIPAAYFNIYTYNSLEIAAGGSGTTYATMDTFIAGLGPTNEYNNLNSSPVPSTSNSFANYVYSQRPTGLEVFVGAY